MQPFSRCCRCITAAKLRSAIRRDWYRRPSASRRSRRSNQRAGWLTLDCATSQLALGVAGKQSAAKGLGAKVPPQPGWWQAQQGTTRVKQQSTEMYSTSADGSACISVFPHLPQKGRCMARRRSRPAFKSCCCSCLSASIPCTCST